MNKLKTITIILYILGIIMILTRFNDVISRTTILIACLMLLVDSWRSSGNNNRIKFVKHSPYVAFEQKGDLVDLNCCGLERIFKGNVKEKDGIIRYKKGDIFRVSLGFAMELPQNKKANVYPRSGTRKNFNVILTNSVGQIDNSYKGTDDIWLAEFYAIDDGEMELGNRILQFEIVDRMPKYKFEETKTLSEKNRSGFGSTGV